MIPCFDASATLERALDSLACPAPFRVEVIVSDDGSPYPVDVPRAIGGHEVRVIRSEVNRGKAHACNAAFARSRGAAVLVLDADDEMTSDWVDAMLELLERWPPDSPLAFAWTRTQEGERTGAANGLFSRRTWLAGAAQGEYLPIFRGGVARTIGYATPGCRKICGTLSYARILERGPLFVHPRTMRIYHTETASSLSKSPFRVDRALDSYRCFHAARTAIEEHDAATGEPGGYYLARLYAREAIYLGLGVSRKRALGFALRSARRIGMRRLVQVIAALSMPAPMLEHLVSRAKRHGVIQRFG